MFEFLNFHNPKKGSKKLTQAKEDKIAEKVIDRMMLLERQGYSEDEVFSIMLSEIEKAAFSLLTPAEKVEYALSELSKNEKFVKEIEEKMPLEEILKRHGVYSEENLLEMKKLSNKNRMKAGKKPIYPEVEDDNTENN